jgi:hypothetical protein
MSSDRSFSDDPIDSEDADVLDRKSFVDQLVQVLGSAAVGKASSVFALVGAWGSGKSSVLRLLQNQLATAAPSWQVVDFNPWSYADETALQLGFFRELRSVLPSAGRAAGARQALGRLSTSIAPIGGVVGAFAGVDGESLLSNMGKLLEGDGSTSKAYSAAVEALQESPYPILMVMDDLDRLDPSELMRVAKLVRLVGRLPNVFYLLSYDEATLLDVLTRTSLVGNRESRAKDYLEKIVQVRFDLPPLRLAQRSRLLEQHITGLQERLQITLSANDRDRLMRTLDGALAPRLQTVRSIHRFFAQLDQLTTSLAKDVDLVDYILITWLRTAEPRVYGLIYRKRDWVLGIRTGASLWSSQPADDGAKRHDSLLKEILGAGVDPIHVDDVAIALGSVFPALRSDLVEERTRYTRSVHEEGTLRVADPDYFDRYFANRVPDEDVSDEVVRSGVLALNEKASESADLEALRHGLMTNGSLVLRKIERERPDPLRVVEWLMDLLRTQPDATDGDSAVAPLLQWALLQTPPNSIDSAVALFAETEAGRLQLIHFGWNLRTGRDLTAMYAHISREQVDALWERLQNTLAALIEQHLQEHIAEAGINAPSAYMESLWLWEAIKPGAAKQWLQAQRASNVWSLQDQLARMVSVGYSSARPGVPVLDHIQRDTFFSFFDPEDVSIELG